MPLAETAAIRPQSPYGASKAAAEALIRDFAQGSRAATVLRFANVVGPGERRPSVVSSVSRQIAEIESGKGGVSVRHGRLDEARDLVDVRDVARAIAACCQSDPSGARTYNVGTGNAVAISDVVYSLVGMARVPVRLELDPTLVRAGPASRVALNPSALRAAAGWRAEVPLERSLADVLSFWRGQVHG
jgi:GDP-4-dehydro-6-deoxy-D-mannose reductase